MTSAEITGRRFELLHTLGVGSFGSVYLAEMESSGGFRRRVALKLLHPNWDPGSDASRRLRDEARLLGRLQHRHIVRVDDLIRLEGRWALVMEYVPGVDLAAVVAPPSGATGVGAIPVRGALEIVAAVASALRAASTSPDGDGRPLSVVHRDIKPSNIRIGETGDVKVLDFGVARADFAGRESKTERVRYGSLGYMAPERLLGGEESSSGDVYSLGVVLYELCLRTTYGRTELGEEAQAAQVKRASDALAVLAGEEVAELLRKTLAYLPENRPSAREVEEIARRLAALRAAPGADRPTADPDLASWCMESVPLLAGGAPGREDGVTGRVMAEAETAGRPIVNSGTLAVPEGSELLADDAGTMPGRAPDPLAGEDSGTVGLTTPGGVKRSGPTKVVAHSDTIVLPEESPARVGGPLRMALLAGLLVLAGLVGGVGYSMMNAERSGADEAAEPKGSDRGGSGSTAKAGSPAANPNPAAGADAITGTGTPGADTPSTGTASAGTTNAPSPAIPVPVGATPAPLVPASGLASNGAASTVRPTSASAASTSANAADAGSGAGAASATSAAATTPTTGSAAARLRSAKFVLGDATQTLTVVCGDVRATGTGNALVQSFPAGRCTVSAGGATTTVDVQEPRKVDCTLSAGSLSCR